MVFQIKEDFLSLAVYCVNYFWSMGGEEFKSDFEYIEMPAERINEFQGVVIFMDIKGEYQLLVRSHAAI